MKLNKHRNKDYYVFIENGSIVEEEKDKDSLKIMNENSTFSDVENKQQSDFYDNLLKHTNNLPKKKTFNTIIIVVISVICLLLAFNIFGLLESIQNDSYNQLNIGLNDISVTDESKEEVFFLSDVIHNSNSKLKKYYDDLNSLINNYNNRSFYSEISSIKNKAQIDLNDVNSLNEYLIYKNFEKPIGILKERFENIVELCDSLENANFSQSIKTYNSYAKKEIELQNNLISSISIYFEKLNIEYKITEDNTFVYSKK